MPLAEIIGEGGIFVDGDWVESKDQDPNGEVRLVQLADIGDGRYINKSSRFLTSSKARELKCTFLQSGDILVARMPDPIGRACIFPGDKRQCVTVVDVCIIRPNKEVDRRWLLHAINSPAFRNQVAQHINGTTRQRISRTNLGTIAISTPPFPEQRRIADILDKADAIRRKRKEAIALTEELLRSAFLEMFGDPVTNPKGWEVKPLGTVIERLEAGWSANGEARPRTSGELGVLRVSAVTSGFFRPEEHKAIAPNAADRELVTPRAGDLLFSRANTRELVAATCLVERDEPSLFLPDKLWRIVPRSRIATTPYLRFLLAHHRFRTELTRAATGTSGSMLNVSMDKLRALSAPIPPFSMQIRFSDFVWSSLRLRTRHRVAEDTTDQLFHSLTQYLFMED